jgi:hypothetical protein
MLVMTSALKIFGHDSMVRTREESGGLQFFPMFIGKVVASGFELIFYPFSYLAGYYSFVGSNASYEQYFQTYVLLQSAIMGLSALISVSFSSENSFLVALQRFERAELTEAVVRFEAADLQALIDAGAATFVLNREYFPAAMSDMVNAYEAVLSALFGPPVARGKRVLAWDTGGWSGATEVPFDAFSWPPGVRPGGPTLGVQSPRWGSLAFSAPMPPAGGREAPRKPKKVEKR